MKKNITLSAEDALITRARKRARDEHTSLNTVFRLWLEHYAAREGAGQNFDKVMEELDQVKAGRIYSRDEMNAR